MVYTGRSLGYILQQSIRTLQESRNAGCIQVACEEREVVGKRWLMGVVNAGSRRSMVIEPMI